MTKREFYVSVIAKLGAESEEGIHAQGQLDKLDAANTKAKEAQSVKRQENEAFAEEVLASLEADTVYTAAQVGAAFGITSHKASYILRGLVASGDLAQTDVVVKANKAEGIAAKRVKGYYWTK